MPISEKLALLGRRALFRRYKARYIYCALVSAAWFVGWIELLPSAREPQVRDKSTRENLATSDGGVERPAGGDGSNPDQALDFREATGLVQFVTLQADWFRNAHPRSELLSFSSFPGKYDLFTLRQKSGAKVYVYFKPATSHAFWERMEDVWGRYMDELVKPAPDLVFVMHRKDLERTLKAAHPRTVIPYVITQLHDERRTGLEKQVGGESGRWPLRVCDLAWLFLLHHIEVDMRPGSSETSLASAAGFDPAPARPGKEAFQQLGEWWDSIGRKLLESDRLHWREGTTLSW